MRVVLGCCTQPFLLNQGPEVVSKVFLYHSQTYFWDILSLTLELALLDRLIDQQAPISYLSLCLPSNSSMRATYCLTFTWVPGMQIRVIMLAQEALYPRNTFSGPSPPPPQALSQEAQVSLKLTCSWRWPWNPNFPTHPHPPQLSRCWAYRQALPRLACFLIFTNTFFNYISMI